MGLTETCSVPACPLHLSSTSHDPSDLPQDANQERSITAPLLKAQFSFTKMEMTNH